MSNIAVRMYDSVSAYENRIAARTKSVPVSIADLIRYCITSGGFSTREVSPVGCAFYRELIRMAVEEDRSTSRLCRRDDYAQAEQSIKSAISFFLGLVSARVVAEKVLFIPVLYHLKDRRLAVFPSNGPHPDFFGENAMGGGAVIEAKGTCGERVANATIAHAVNDQLGNLKSVRDSGNGRAYGSLKGYTVGIGFESRDNRHEAVISCVDPTPRGGSAVSLDLDKAAYAYYDNVLSWFRVPGAAHIDVEASESLTAVRVGDMTVGIEERVHEVMRRVDGSSPQGLHKTMTDLAIRRMERMASVNEEVRALSLRTERSMGLDGVMVEVPVVTGVTVRQSSSDMTI